MRLGVALLVLAASATCASQHALGQAWKPAIYHGLIMGKCTRDDLSRVLGTPKWKGKEQDTGIPIITYDISDPILGTLVVYETGGIVTSMTLEPRTKISKNGAIRLLGPRYKTVRYSTDDCLTAGGAAPIYESPDGPIVHLEYRDRGLAVALRGDEVAAIIWASKPFGPTQSACKGSKPSR